MEVQGKLSERSKAVPEGWGARHTFTLMCFLSYALCFALRVDIAVAIVAMANQSEFHSNFKVFFTQ